MAKNGSDGRPRRSGRSVTTRTGRVLKVNSSLGGRWKMMREAKSRRRAERLAGLPKSRFKRAVYRLHPRRLAAYWFSRDGGIMALKIAGIGIVVLFITTLGVFAYFRKDLPKINDFSKLDGSISYYDRTGTELLFQDYDAVKRVPVKSEEISKYIKEATIAIEDRDFYNHRGFDIRGITRAAFTDISTGSAAQGGSTITQQLVKLTQDWTQERTLARKAKELILAVELERSYTKNEILTGYLNAAPYGSVIYGVQAASSDYFHKDAKDLTLAEATFLAAIPKAPAYYSPYSDYFDKESLIGRQHYIIDQMRNAKKISKQEAESAKKIDIMALVQPRATSKYAGIKAPYFVLSAKNELARNFLPGKETTKVGGWKVITTVDMKLQRLAEEQVNKGIDQVRRQGGDVAAFAAEDVETGQMVAVVGGIDFRNQEFGEINYAQTRLPPGSSFKPYDYLALIENSTSAGAGSVLYDVQAPLPGYPCTRKARPPDGNCLNNYDFRYPGPLTLRYALGGSRNVPAVKAFLTTGSDKVIKTAEALGLRSSYKCYRSGVDVNAATVEDETPCYGAAGIGDGAFLRLDEHVHAYATISRLGAYIPQSYILKIFDSDNDQFYEWKKAKPEQAVRPDSAYIVTDMIADPNASYFPSSQKIHRYQGWHFGLKTGTTNDAKDGWLMGMSTKYAAGVWVGHHTRQKEMRGTMESMTRPIWGGWMRGAHKDLPAKNWTQPAGVKQMPAYVVRTHVGVGSVEPSPVNDLYPSWYKPKTTANQTSVIDRVSTKLATNCTPALAKETVGGSSNAEQFSVDIYYGSGGARTGDSNTTANDDIHSCSDSPPGIASVYVGGADVTTGGNTTCTTNPCTITATVSAGTHALSNAERPQFPGTVHLLIDGGVSQTAQVSGSPATVSFSYTGTGSHTVSIQVIDSVLYSATSSAATVVFGPAPTTYGPGNNPIVGNPSDPCIVGNGRGRRIC